LSVGRREGPAVQLFGRLAPGATLEYAQAQLTVLGSRAAVDFPDTHEHLRPQVVPYTTLFQTALRPIATFSLSANAALLLFMALVCGNVALLTFARATTRETEIAIRGALGASRGRIVMQLFSEALVLSIVAAIVGLSAGAFVLRWVTG